MGKKVTSSSPIKTLAFDAIPNYWTYANTVTKHKPPTVDSTGGAADGSYYASPLEPTTGGGNLGGNLQDNDPVDPCQGLTDEQCQKLKGKSGTKTPREQRLLDRISKSKNPAQIARLEKRLGGHLWREDKAMARKEYRAGEIGKGKTFFGRLIQGADNLFEQDPHKRHEHLRKASGTAKNPDSKARERSLTKINLGKARAKCIGEDKEWDRATDTCKPKPQVNPNANTPSNNKNQRDDHAYTRATTEGECVNAGGRWSEGECWAG